MPAMSCSDDRPATRPPQAAETRDRESHGSSAACWCSRRRRHYLRPGRREKQRRGTLAACGRFKKLRCVKGLWAKGASCAYGVRSSKGRPGGPPAFVFVSVLCFVSFCFVCVFYFCFHFACIRLNFNFFFFFFPPRLVVCFHRGSMVSC